MIDAEHRKPHWRRTRLIALGALLAIMSMVIIVSVFADTLNGIAVMRIAFGYYLLSQGIIWLMVIAVFWFAARQDAIDRQYGASEYF
jgi:putative solute:sodium symporter small subunit